MAKKISDENVTILENKKINGKYFKLAFRSAALSRNVRPGQFLQVKVQTGRDPYFRRPFSYYRAASNRVEILYEVLGRGTAVLSEKKKGDTLKVMGPLGNGFATVRRKKTVLIAGGVGVPPLLFLAEKGPASRLLIGTKSKLEVLPSHELKRTKAKVMYATEDGSCGYRGMVTGLLEQLIVDEDPRKLFLQTCGPVRMMRAVISLAGKYGIEGEASWDETMACGVGACLGCMVETKDGMRRACADGPVFRFKDLAP